MSSHSTDFQGQVLLGKYAIERPLGEGGMGEVWLGTHSLTGRKIAIKLLDESLRDHVEVVERFGREARAASAIQHPGIVEVLDFDTLPDGRPFLVMEFLEGESLASRIEKRGRLSVEESTLIMAQLLDALEAAHEHGVVHRDLKPDNIFLVPRARGGETVKVLDFGISHKADERVSKLTVQGSVLGTPHYMAPEQARGDAGVDGRTDVYAAGVVFYECIVGDVPFDAPNYNALLHRILSEEPASPSSRGIQVDPRIEAIILRALSKKRELRPQSAGAMLTELRAAFAAQLDGGPEATSARPERDTLSDQLKPSTSDPAAALSFDLPAEFSAPNLPAGAAPQQLLVAGGTAATGLTLDPEFGVAQAAVAARPPRPEVAAAPPPSVGMPWQLKAVIGGVVTLLVIVGAALAVKFSSGDDGPPPARAIGGDTGAPTPPPPAPVRTNVEVELRGVPATALVKLDGFPPASLPFRVRAGSKHVVEVEVEGYEPVKIEFEAKAQETPMVIEVHLRPILGTGARPSQDPGAGTPSTPEPVEAPIPDSVAPADPAVIPAEPSPTP